MAEWSREQAGAEACVHLPRRLARVLEGDGGLLRGPLGGARRRDLRQGHLRRRARPRPVLAGDAPPQRGRRLRLHLRRLLAALRLPAASARSATPGSTADRDQRIGERHARHRGGRARRLELLRARLRLPADLLRGHADRRGRSRSPTSSRPSTASRSATTTRCRGYALADAVVAAIEAAGSTEGPAIAEALFSGQVQDRLLRNADGIHRDVPPASAGRATRSRSSERRQHADRHRGRGVDPRHRRREPVLRRAAGRRVDEGEASETTEETDERRRRRLGPREARRGGHPRPLRGRPGRRRHRPDARAGPDHGADRPQRRRQDDVHERGQRLRAADRRHRDDGRHRRDRLVAAEARSAGARPDVPGRRDVPGAHGLRERRARGARRRARPPGGARKRAWELLDEPGARRQLAQLPRVRAPARRGAPGRHRPRGRGRSRSSFCSTSRRPGSTTPRAWRSPRRIAQLREQLGCGVLLVEHDMRIIFRVCERIQVLDYGKSIAVGTPEEIRTSKAVIAAYLGEKGAQDAAAH